MGNIEQLKKPVIVLMDDELDSGNFDNESHTLRISLQFGWGLLVGIGSERTVMQEQ
ncbi:MAG: hypothetical protein GYB33_21740 [Gammaproteobacteria bacterium]|uniref:hypothetical protein n=1 Tax=Pseudomaricurvus alcaniphilus TaxID=1166482 RepID=UPI001A9FE48D|nr:hypothetical protein [Pseudomaricurvus alcaniphilus]MBR9912971.1 hypothetical protein [Gammaproteobacteria bacterium]NHN36453.1 hypothetical protein [Pseudomaricurvus alcaniphilus]